jgi:phosphonoacetaldehyde hydrolase
MMAGIVAVLFDWAGTMIDFGSRAPVIAMEDVLTKANVPVDVATIRRYMGMAKREHVLAILTEPTVAQRWREAWGTDWTDGDIDRLMVALEPAMQASALACSEMIPGAVDVFQTLRARGIKVGSTTGYTQTMMVPILKAAAEQGYDPEVTICAGMTPQGRPAPLMLWRAMAELGAWPARSCVAVDDAPVGISAGVHAGLWTVGIAGSGNGVGLCAADFHALDEAEKQRSMAPVVAEFAAAGVDFIIDTVADLPRALAMVEEDLAKGAGPGGQQPRVLIQGAWASVA